MAAITSSPSRCARLERGSERDAVMDAFGWDLTNSDLQNLLDPPAALTKTNRQISACKKITKTLKTQQGREAFIDMVKGLDSEIYEENCAAARNRHIVIVARKSVVIGEASRRDNYTASEPLADSVLSQLESCLSVVPPYQTLHVIAGDSTGR